MPYRYESVDAIPDGTSPPSIAELTKKVKEVASYAVRKFDPVDLKICRDCLKTSNAHGSHLKNATSIRDDLSTFAPDEPAFTEKTYKFKLTGNPDVWISSTKNSDGTISYWFQHPILPFHIQAAFLNCMDIPVTPDNLTAIGERFPAVYSQMKQILHNDVAKCEQIEPLYVDMAIKSLLSRGYSARK